MVSKAGGNSYKLFMVTDPDRDRGRLKLSENGYKMFTVLSYVSMRMVRYILGSLFTVFI
jgi:hypothetical protein